MVPEVTDYFREAERLLKPQPQPEPQNRVPALGDMPALGDRTAGRTLPPDPAAAQIHATLAVASQLARIATALEQMAGTGPR